TRPSGEKPEALVQSIEDLRRAEGSDPCRGELDRERNAVETPADLADHGIVRSEREIRRRGARTLDEKPRRRRCHAVTSERRHGPGLLAFDRQRLAARGEERHVRAAGKDLLRERRDRWE